MSIDQSWLNKAKTKGNPVRADVYLLGVQEYSDKAIKEIQKLAKDLKDQGSSQYIGVLRALTKLKQLKSK